LNRDILMSTTTDFRSSSRQRGSVMIVALLLAAAIAIVLGSYLQVGRTAQNLAHRGYYANVAVNLAETGLEKAMWSLNGGGWADWEISGSDRYDSFAVGNYAGNTTGVVRVYVENHSPAPGTAPRIFARSTITPHRGNVLEKWLEIDCVLGSSPFRGVVAQRIEVSGGAAIFDSYRSRINGTRVNWRAPLPDGSGINQGANITIVALSMESDTVDASNSKVYGYIAVSSTEADAVNFSRNAMLTGDFSAPARTQDLSRITRDASLSLKRMSMTPGEGTFLGEVTAATTLGTGTYTATDIQLNGNGKNLVIEGHVLLRVPTTSLSATVFSVGGGALITIADGASLTIETPGNVAIAGNTVVNDGVPGDFTIIGTRDRTLTNNRQTITLSGQGDLKAVVYAPDANITLNGGGSTGHFYGSLVGQNVQLNGGANVTWDENLGDDDRLRVWRVGRWIEYTEAAERAAVASKLNFSL
jgi:hypothetical protein